MEEKKRTILAVLISCTILAAVLYSFGVNFFRSTTKIVVADPSTATQSPGVSAGEDEILWVEVTPQTVQSVIAGMTRYESYERTVHIRYLWEEGSGELTARVTENDGWLRCDVTMPGGVVEHTLLGNGRLWYWYDSGPDYLSAPAEGREGDLVQHIPTYEDILRLDGDQIVRADYEEKDGAPCICVEAELEGERIGRWWVSVSSGLLVAAEMEEQGAVVYTMSSGDMESPGSLGRDELTLPDGTYLPEAD